jgi:hypothetical protein
MMQISGLALSFGETGAAVGQRLTASGWYYNPVSGWYYSPLGYMNPAPKTVTLYPGDKLKITLAFNYTGQAVDGVYARYAIGVYGAYGFDEKVYVTKTFNIPANLSTVPITVTDEAILTLPTSGVGADWNDICVKIWNNEIGGTELLTSYIFGYENAIVIAGVTPTITQFKILDFGKV